MARRDGIVQDQNGIALEGALIYVFNKTTGDLVPLFDDNNAALPNPVTTGPLGEWFLNALDGTYRAEYYFRGLRYKIDTDFVVGTGVGFEGPTWFVSPSVSGTGGSGTLASPWSLEYADGGAGGTIKPGDTVILRGQKPGGTAVPAYRPYTLAGQSRTVGFNISISGTETQPITWKPFPGEIVTFSDPIDTSAGWTKVTTKEGGGAIDASANVYESNFTVAGTTNVVVAYYAQGGDFYVIGALRGPTGSGPYTTSTNIEAMYATSSRFRLGGIYYPGPCIARLGNGKLRIRLDPCYSEAHETTTGNPFFGETSQVYPASTNPALVDLRIYVENDVGLTINGDFNVIDGGTLGNHGIVFHGFERGGVRDFGNNNTIKGCQFYAPRIGLNVGNVGATSAGSYYENTLDGMLDYYKSPFSRGDVKNGIELLVYNRGQPFAVGTLASNGKRWRNIVRRGYDGTVIASRGWKVGGCAAPINGLNALSARDRRNALWYNQEIVEQIWDDGKQVYSAAQGTEFAYMTFKGAGISRDGATSSVSQGGNKVKVNHCIFDGFNWRVIWDRRGRNYSVIADATATARSTINGSFSASATTITVADGTAFAALSLPRNLTLCKGSAPWSIEQVQLTAVVGNNLTVVRGQTPSGGLVPDTAFALSTGDIVTTTVRDPRGTNEGRTSANVLPTHGVPSGTSYRMAWDFDHNTVLTAPSFNDMPNFYLPVMMFGTEASNVEPGSPKNIVTNNLFLLGGAAPFNNPSLNPATAYLGATRIYSGRGEDIIDGNAYIGTNGVPLRLIQLMRDSIGTNYDNSITTIAGFRAAQLLTDVQTFAGYAPGWESKGIAYTASMASQIDANYRPLDSRVWANAIELAQFGVSTSYEAFCGAMAPLSEG